MNSASRKATLRKAAFPAIVGLLLAGWLITVVVSISNEPDDGKGAPSQAELVSEVKSAIQSGDSNKLKAYFSESAGDAYADSLIDKLSAGSGKIEVIKEGSGSRSFIAIRKGDGCAGFDLRRNDGAWVVDAVPRLQGCRE